MSVTDGYKAFSSMQHVYKRLPALTLYQNLCKICATLFYHKAYNIHDDNTVLRSPQYHHNNKFFKCWSSINYTFCNSPWGLGGPTLPCIDRCRHTVSSHASDHHTGRAVLR